MPVNLDQMVDFYPAKRMRYPLSAPMAFEVSQDIRAVAGLNWQHRPAVRIPLRLLMQDIKLLLRRDLKHLTLSLRQSDGAWKILYSYQPAVWVKACSYGAVIGGGDGSMHNHIASPIMLPVSEAVRVKKQFKERYRERHVEGDFYRLDAEAEAWLSQAKAAARQIDISSWHNLPVADLWALLDLDAQSKLKEARVIKAIEAAIEQPTLKGLAEAIGKAQRLVGLAFTQTELMRAIDAAKVVRADLMPKPKAKAAVAQYDFSGCRWRPIG